MIVLLIFSMPFMFLMFLKILLFKGFSSLKFCLVCFLGYLRKVIMFKALIA